MNLVILDAVTSFVAAWPLMLVGIVIAALVGNAFVRGGRRSDALHDWRGDAQTRTCRSTGHRYVKDATGWCCSHCGDEIRHNTPSQRVRETAGV
jgi:hypothetical protein